MGNADLAEASAGLPNDLQRDGAFCEQILNVEGIRFDEAAGGEQVMMFGEVGLADGPQF